MGAGTYERKQFAGGAPATTVTSTLTDVAVSFDIDDASGWPDATNPFVAVIDRGLATEEKILVGARTSVTLSSITRGYDDTSAVAHSTGATIEHVIDASTIDQLNRAINLLDAKGQLLGFNGTNVTALTPTAYADAGEDGYVVQVKNAEATGLEIARPIHVVDDAVAPTVTGVPRVWFDQASGLVRTSDGVDWKIPATCPVFASTGARDTFFGATPVQDGNMCIVGSGMNATLQVWDGTNWIYQGIPRFASSTERDAYYTAPIVGDMAFLIDSNFLTEYRVSEWVTINHKVVTSATQPTGATVLEGDIWLQPLV
jgi:hypothetical protein